MKNIKFISAIILFASASILLSSCNDDDPEAATTYSTVKDQMARPAINTVFVGSAKKDQFNGTIPSQQSAAFLTDFTAVLTNFGYTTNILGQTKDAFAGLLVTDVLNVKTTGVTTFYDGNAANTLSGRALANDVIDVELILIFGGATGASNSGLTSDNVGANDKAFLTTFPYLASPF